MLHFGAALLFRFGQKRSEWHPIMLGKLSCDGSNGFGKMAGRIPKPLKERRIVRSVINQTNPDILAIQEIGDRVYLNELWEDLNFTNGTQFKYSAWIPGLGDGEQRAFLALLSKIPFTLLIIMGFEL